MPEQATHRRSGHIVPTNRARATGAAPGRTAWCEVRLEQIGRAIAKSFWRREGAALGKTEKSQEAAAIQQLLLDRLVSQIAALLQDQYLGHQDGGIWRTATLGTRRRGAAVSIA